MIANMNIITPENAEKVPFALNGRKMYSSPTAEIVHLTLKPGETVDRHSNPFDVVFYMLEGEATIEIDGVKAILKTDCCLEVKRDKPRGMSNNTGKDVRILVFKLF